MRKLWPNDSSTKRLSEKKRRDRNLRGRGEHWGQGSHMAPGRYSLRVSLRPLHVGQLDFFSIAESSRGLVASLPVPLRF
jgi:hypothetical protein